MIGSRRIFQIGFNKCGTTTLHRFFSDNGLRSVHWENGAVAENFARRMDRGDDPFADYPQVEAFTDMVKVSDSVLLEPYKSFEYIHRWYPGSFFILNTRNPGDWIESRVRHGFVARYRSVLGLPDEASVRRYWLEEWYAHHARVLQFFRAMPDQLLVYDIDRDEPATLAGFLARGWRLDPALFGHENSSAGSRNSLAYPPVTLGAVKVTFG